MLDFTKLDITKTNIKYNNYSGLRDSGPKSCQGRPQLLETFKPSYALSKVKNEKVAIRNRITEFDKRRISQPKNEKANKP